MKPKISQYLFLTFFLVYLSYHLYTLSASPLPWEDDTTFASISKSFLEDGKFYSGVGKEAQYHKECFLYGPVYFVLTASSFKLFGFGIFQFRIICFLSGLLCAFFLYRIFFQKTGNRDFSIFISVIFLLDPFIQLSMHEGRMDLLCVAFLFGALFYLEKDDRRHTLASIIFSGTLIALAMLTTPRIGFSALFLFIYQLYKESFKPESSVKNFLWWILPSALLAGAWMFYAFGGPLQTIEYFRAFEDPANSQGINPTLGFQLYIPRHEYLVIAITLFFIAAGIYKNKLRFFNRITIVGILSAICFYCFVIDWGPYSVFVLPFYYYFIFHAAGIFSFHWKNWQIYPLALLLIFNLGYSILKAGGTLYTLPQRDYKIADEFIKKHIPPGSKVLGYGMHYYSVAKAGSDYQYIDKYNSLETRERLHREVLDYDYIIIDNVSAISQKDVYDYYFSKDNFLKIAELAPVTGISKPFPWSLLSDMEDAGYACSVYARVKIKHENPVSLHLQ